MHMSSAHIGRHMDKQYVNKPMVEKLHSLAWFIDIDEKTLANKTCIAIESI